MRFVIALSALLAASPAAAQHYVDADIKTLTTYAVENGLIPLKDENAFVSYVNLTDCDLMSEIRNNQFYRQESFQKISEALQKKAGGDLKYLYIEVPALFNIKGYNFETQSFTISHDTQMNRVGMIGLTEGAIPLCDPRHPSRYSKSLPQAYRLKTNVPVSLRRIPLQKEIAEPLLEQLDASPKSPEDKAIYASFFIQIEPISGRVGNGVSTGVGTLFGQLDRIDLFADQAHTILIKRLNYAENY